MDEREDLNLAENRYYELGFLVKDENVEPLKAVLAKNNASVYEESSLTKVSLAYPVKKETMAFFGYCRFTTSPEEAIKIQEALKFEPAVLRALFIKLSDKAGKAAKTGLSEPRKVIRRRETEVKKEGAENSLSNEDLEKKIEEILNN